MVDRSSYFVFRLAFAAVVAIGLALAPAWVAAQDQADPAAALYADADAHFAKGEFGAALDVYQSILARYPLGQHPSSVRAARSAAWCAAQLQNSREALRHLAQAVKFGFRNADDLAADPHFTALRENPKFVQLLGMIRRGQHTALDGLNVDEFIGAGEATPTPTPSGEKAFVGEIYVDGDFRIARSTNKVAIDINFQGQQRSERLLETFDSQDTILAVDEMGRPAVRERVFVRFRQEITRDGRTQRGAAPFELRPYTSELGDDDMWKLRGPSNLPDQFKPHFETTDWATLFAPGKTLAVGDKWTADKDALQAVYGRSAALHEASYEVTFTGIEKVEGTRIATLATHLRIAQQVQPAVFQVRDLTGEIRFDLDTHRTLSDISSGTLEIVIVQGNQRTVAATGTTEVRTTFEYGNVATDHRIAAVGGWLGFETQTDDDKITVAAIYQNSPAVTAGLKKGDVITAVNGKPLANANEISELMRDIRMGDAIELTISRAGEAQSVKLAPAPRPDNPQLVEEAPSTPEPTPGNESALGRVRLGLRLVANETPAGMLVQSASGLAQEAGIKTGDVIVKFRGTAVTNSDEFREALRVARVNETVEVRIVRQGQELTVRMTLAPAND